MLQKTIQILLLTLCAGLNFLAQENIAPPENQNSENPIKVDEFGKVGECDLNARIENFYITELQANPSATGYIIVYYGKNQLPASIDSNLMERQIKDQIRFLRFDESRIVFVRGGFRDEIATELFLVPSGAAPPEPTATMPAPTMPEDKAFLYDSKFLSDDHYDFTNEFVLPSVAAKMEEENRLAEEQAKIEESNSEQVIKLEPTAEEDFEIKEPTPEEIEEIKFSWVSEKFGELITKQQGASGVIIFYADNEYYDVKNLQNLIEAGKQKIAEANKIPVAKIQVLYGGYRDMIETEFWIVPEKGKSPTPRPEERPVEEAEY